ncbi:MAG TPA: protein kinase [Solirubrobacteraceae bacterium]|jgi:serine/threonine-protein kinase|nr:protein kinase [Solirubrobacteraceae bacterium]
MAQLPGGVPLGYRAAGWEIVGHIASGAWASVYAARRSTGGTGGAAAEANAALKILPTGGLAQGQRADLWEGAGHEVAFSARADHPRLIRTLEVFVIDDPDQPTLDGAVVLAMERAATSLKGLLDAACPPDPAPDAGRLIREICEALVGMHGLGWVHGDLKPGNVLLMADGSVRLGDFGLARELEGTHAYAPRLGSSDFLPPEWWSERIGERGVATRTTGDIWALGVTAHQILTGGMYPFPGTTARARTAAAQAYADGQSELRLADELPPDWRSIIADCLAPDHVARRPHSAKALLPRISAVETKHSDAAVRRPVGGRARRRLWRRAAPRVAAAVLAGGLAAGGAALGVIGRGGSAGRRDARIRVYDAETACQHSRLASCRMGLARDPYATYVRGNVVGYARHGDELTAECYLPDGTLVRSENGRTSTRWYKVRFASAVAWLPGIRVWPGATPAVGRC